MVYATAADYAFLSLTGAIPEEKRKAFLEEASRQVDSLTYCRILKHGFENLSAAQQELIRLATVRQADFQYAYGEMLDSPLSAYSINGVSMGFDRGALVTRGGVSAQASTVGLLDQTGLTCRRLS